MNKYQEALDKVKYYNICWNEDIEKGVEEIGGRILITRYICRQCNHNVEPLANYCGYCGNKIKWRGDEDEYHKAITTLQELVDNMKFVEEVQTPDYIRVQKELWETKK